MKKLKIFPFTLCVLGAVAVAASANGQTVTGGTVLQQYTPGSTITYGTEGTSVTGKDGFIRQYTPGSTYIYPSTGGAEEAKSFGESVVRQEVETKLKSLLPTFGGDMPEWLKRVEANWDFLDTSKPEQSILTVQPLYQSAEKQDTIFTQGSIYHYALYGDYRWTANIGAGYRKLLANNTVMLGFNSFFDNEFTYGHRRVSIGAEAKWGPLDLGFNNYFAITGDKSAGDNDTERALDGRDVTLKSQLPYVPWMKVGGSYFNWDKEFADSDMLGGSFLVEAALHPNFSVDYKWSSYDVNNNRNRTQNAVYLRFKLANLSEPTLSTSPTFSTKIFETRDLSKETLKKVVRENRIIVERRTTTVGGTITIARGD